MITFARSDLAPALAHLKRASLAIQNVLIQAEPHQARLTVASADVVLIRIVPAIVDVPLRLVVSCRELEAQVRALKQPELTLETAFDKLILSAGNMTRRWPEIDPETFMNPEQGEVLGSCLLDNVSRIAKTIATCTAGDSSRPVLQCIYVKVADGVTTFAAADGFRLATTTQVVAPGDAWSALVPASAWKLAKTLAGKEPVRLSLLADSRALFSSITGSLMVPAMLGVFPAYQQLIPTSATSFQVNRALFAEAITVVSGFAAAHSGITRLLVSDDMLTVQALADDGEITVTLPVTGGNTKIAFECKYLREMLQAFAGSDVITCGTTSPSSPGLFTAPDSSLRVVIMPLFIQW